jgi:Mlc titration factor MtfA (ptsG expression regulator)
MPLYRRLPAPDRAELEGHIHVLLAEKYFEGCNGLVLTDRTRLLIAAHAAVLLLHRDTDYFPLMRSILVYPAAFVGEGKSLGPAGVVTENAGWRTGESWHTPIAGGPVVISWRDTLAGAADPCDGRNVALHEFAHQLDAESGAMDGVPAVEPREHDAWRRLIDRELARLRHALSTGQPAAIDPYGAQSPSEFFAVAVESFFERPHALRAAHPDLYAALASYFSQDPASRSDECASGRSAVA